MHRSSRHNRESLSHDIKKTQWRSRSPALRRRHRKRSESYEASRSLSVPLLPTSQDGIRRALREDDIQTKTDLAVSSLSTDRKTRRYRLSVRKGERFERIQGGKKLFYLTLDVDGIPYGPGKPTWIAEVNKLAAGLDPSCTHIRKQTHEDMCILKDRLDDHFEYSGEFN